MLLGVDVHPDFQAGLNVEQLARDGMTFVVVKATQGAGGYTSGPTFDDWIRRARAAGMIPGAYHWLDSSDPVRQADRFLARLAPVGGPDGLLLQIDCEDLANPATSDHLSKFVARMNARTNNHPLLLYSGSWWYGPHLGGFNAANLGLRLWHSHYVTGSGAASSLAKAIGTAMWTPGYGGFTDATILQFTDKGSAGGIVGNIDLNAYRGTRDQLTTLTGGTVAGEADKAFSAAYTGTETFISGQSWMSKAIEGPIRALTSKVDALATTVAAMSSALTASAVREQATMAALDKLGAVITAGGGNVDIAAIKAEILDAEARIRDRLHAAQQAAADALDTTGT